MMNLKKNTKKNNMTNSDEKFKKLIAEMEELILIKAPTLKIKDILIEKSEFFDIPEFTKNNEELDLLRKRYKELYNEIMAIDKIVGKKEIKSILMNKKLLDANKKEASYGTMGNEKGNRINKYMERTISD